MLKSLQITKLDADLSGEYIDKLYHSFQNVYGKRAEDLSADFVVEIQPLLMESGTAASNVLFHFSGVAYLYIWVGKNPDGTKDFVVTGRRTERARWQRMTCVVEPNIE